jgi:hypothetical protein
MLLVSLEGFEVRQSKQQFTSSTELSKGTKPEHPMSCCPRHGVAIKWFLISPIYDFWMLSLPTYPRGEESGQC